jgi:predicted small lipoprotein YifL
VSKIWGVTLLAALLTAAGCGTTGPTNPPSDEAAVQDSAGAAEPVPTDDETGEPLANTLKWTTASEVDNFGFDIYRSLAEDGPFEKITEQPLPGAGTTDEPQRYEFVDEDIDPGTDYYYYIESISLGGVREKFSPIIKAPAKWSGATDD